MAPMRLVTLYFGTNLNTGGVVAPGIWPHFLAQTLRETFPNGLTVTDATGQWRDPLTGAGVTEATHVVTIAAADTHALAARVQAVRDAWRHAAAQQSVGVTSVAVCGAF